MEENKNEKIEELDMVDDYIVDNTNNVVTDDGSVSSDKVNEVSGKVEDVSESVTEKDTDSSKKDGSKNGIIPLIIVVLLIVGVALFFVLNPKSSNTGSKKTTNSKSGVIDQKNKKEETKEEEDDVASSSTSTDEVKTIDVTKSINTTGYNYTDVSDSNQNVGVSIRINDDKKSITISLDGNASKIISDVIHSTWTDQTIEKVISGFDKNIRSTYIGGIGQDVTGTIFYFLMEDGTVQYIRMFELKNNSDGTTYYTTEIHQGVATINKVDGVSGIVKLYGANESQNMSTGAYTTLAALKDGSFYDLGTIIN